MAKAYLSLGSNTGDRLSNIQYAIHLLNSDKNIELGETSTFYETEPWGGKATSWFVNAAVEIKTSLKPIELLRVCQDIEARLGRNRETEGHWGNRPIDIDILFYDDIVFENEILTLPHPYIHKRAFVLVPMLEIAQDFVHPVFHKTIEELHNELENPEDVFLYGTIIGGSDDN